MIKQLMQKLRLANLLRQDSTKSEQADQAWSFTEDPNQNIKLLSEAIGNSMDLRTKLLSLVKGQHVAVLYLESMVNSASLQDNVIRPLQSETEDKAILSLSPRVLLETLATQFITLGDLNLTDSLTKAVEALLAGQTVLLVKGFAGALLADTAGPKVRNIEPPQTEVVVRGAHEGFVEELVTNVSLLRRRLRTAELTLDCLRLGSYSQTTVAIAYLRGLTNPKLVEEVKRRLKGIKIDAILESGYVEQFIEDHPFSPFPTVSNTERPDVVAAKLLEGRVAIIVDGSPFTLVVPTLLVEAFQNAEDYFSRPWYASMIRMVRYIAFAISVLTPAVYVALVTFHQEVIPTPLLITVAAAAEGTPLPSFPEAFSMSLVFEILREAGVRMPRALGQAVSIVGTLVIGQAAIQAGVVGAPIVIAISITALASFVVLPLADVSALLRVFFLFLAAVLGLVGVLFGVIFIVTHLASLRSFGVPFLSPFAPLTPADLKDTVVRAPLWSMVTRPRLIGWHDPKRMEFRLQPSPPDEDEGGEST